MCPFSKQSGGDRFQQEEDNLIPTIIQNLNVDLSRERDEQNKEQVGFSSSTQARRSGYNRELQAGWRRHQPQ